MVPIHILFLSVETFHGCRSSRQQRCGKDSTAIEHVACKPVTQMQPERVKISFLNIRKSK
ncbi:hypothetical protein SFMTTN_1210 [Sulfuriferula multivorans]|uniref:Uncharacterized protein n=1 Tax=Sulfuriferula multivorans TaxID=1559896 RepID=A0A401JCN5_9PROT|nr:hypothetical protein SFMTTN_1210 [Sulfuriferula multivorans]